jgi:hypothetical protein
MATLAHPTAGEYGPPKRGSGRPALERAVDDAPSHIQSPRGWLRRLFARDRSARALIERYGLWLEIEHAYECVTREVGPARVAISAEDDHGTGWVAANFFVASSDHDRDLDLEEELRRERIRRLGSRRSDRLAVLIHPETRAPETGR